MRKIADLIPRLQLRGAEIFAQHLEAALAGRYRTRLFPLEPGEGPRPSGLPELDVDRDVRGALRSRSLRRRVARFEPDLIVAHGGDPLRSAVRARLHRTAPVVSIRIAAVPPALRTPARMASLRRAYAHAAAFVAVGESLRHELVDVFGIAPERIHVIPNGRPVPPPVHESERTIVRSSLGLAPGEALVTWVGAFVAEKNPMLAARLAGPVREAGGRLVMAGGGPLLAQVAGLGEPLVLTGPRSDAARIVAVSDLVVSTSRTEATPGALIEAMLAGVPVVACDVGDVRSLVGEGGLVVPPNDAEELRAAVLTLLGDAARRVELGRRGARAAAPYEIGTIAARYDALYRTLMDGDRTP
jgi:glycosyltransferase involved in cell wall biosynthesis